MDKTDKASKEKVRDLIKGISIAMMATRGNDGQLHARPMGTIDVEFDGTIWFFADQHSGKIHEISDDSDVLLTYADEGRQHYLSITGRASVLHDPGKVAELWSESARVWFPKGPKDPGLALIRVDVDNAEYWDSPSSTMVHIYGYVKAVTTGQRPNPGEQGRVSY